MKPLEACAAPRRVASARLALLAASACAVLLACGGEPDKTSDSALAEQLAALGYVDWAPLEPGGSRAGVILHDANRAQPGLNLISSRAVPGAQLIDLRGELVHEWRNTEVADARWNHVELAANGDLLVVTQVPSLARLDRASNLLWELPLRVHHDLATSAGGDIFALERESVSLDVSGRSVRLLGENVLRVSASGEVLSRVALHEVLADAITPERLEAAAKATPDPRTSWQRALDLWRAPPVDLFHANSIEILPRDVPGLGPTGAALISLRNLDRVIVVDLAAGRVLASLGQGIVERQHHASLLPNGRLLIFDNGRERPYSRVVELDPLTHEIVWEYSGTPARSLRSSSQGGAERLSNGNVLVTESERGRALEVTRDGEIVWEFLHPRTDAARSARASIYRVTRVALE